MKGETFEGDVFNNKVLNDIIRLKDMAHDLIVFLADDKSNVKIEKRNGEVFILFEAQIGLVIAVELCYTKETIEILTKIEENDKDIDSLYKVPLDSWALA